MKLNNPAWLKGSMSDALRMVVKRASARKQMTKLAEGEEGGWSEWLKNLGGQASEYANQIGTGVTEGAKAIWANPHAQNALIGAGVGAGLGGLNSLVNKDRRKRFFSDVLTGGLMGGAAGLGGSALYHYGLKGKTPIEGANNLTVDPAKAKEETRAITQIASSDPAKADQIKAFLPKLDAARAAVNAAEDGPAKVEAEKKLNELMQKATDTVRATNSGGGLLKTWQNAGQMAGQATVADTLGALDPGLKAFTFGVGDPHAYKDVRDTAETIGTPLAALGLYKGMRYLQPNIPGLMDLTPQAFYGSAEAKDSAIIKHQLARLDPKSPAYEQLKKTLGGDEAINNIHRAVNRGDVIQTGSGSSARNMTRTELQRARAMLRDYQRGNTPFLSRANLPAILAGLSPLVYREFFSPYSWRTGENQLTDASKARSPSQ